MKSFISAAAAFDALPTELLRFIFSFDLDAWDLAACGGTCSAWRAASLDASLWRRLCDLDWNIAPSLGRAGAADWTAVWKCCESAYRSASRTQQVPLEAIALHGDDDAVYHQEYPHSNALQPDRRSWCTTPGRDRDVTLCATFKGGGYALVWGVVGRNSRFQIAAEGGDGTSFDCQMAACECFASCADEIDLRDASDVDRMEARAALRTDRGTPVLRTPVPTRNITLAPLAARPSLRQQLARHRIARSAYPSLTPSRWTPTSLPESSLSHPDDDARLAGAACLGRLEFNNPAYVEEVYFEGRQTRQQTLEADLSSQLHCVPTVVRQVAFKLTQAFNEDELNEPNVDVEFLGLQGANLPALSGLLGA